MLLLLLLLTDCHNRWASQNDNCLRNPYATLPHSFRMNLEVFYKNREVLEKGFDEFLSCASIYEKRFLLTSTLTRDFRDVTHTCVLEVPYANAYATLTRSLRPQCFFDGPYSGASARLAPSLRRHGATLRAHVLLTPILTRGLRQHYATAFLTTEN